MKRVVFGGLLSIVLLVGGLAVWLWSLPSLCGNDITMDLLSPDGRHRAILFERNCGAMDGFSTQVAIVDAEDELPDEPGNVMIADGAPWEGPWSLEWTGPAALTIKVHPQEPLFQAETRVVGVAIRYEPGR